MQSLGLDQRISRRLLLILRLKTVVTELRKREAAQMLMRPIDMQLVQRQQELNNVSKHYVSKNWTTPARTETTSESASLAREEAGAEALNETHCSHHYATATRVARVHLLTMPHCSTVNIEDEYAQAMMTLLWGRYIIQDKYNTIYRSTDAIRSTLIKFQHPQRSYSDLYNYHNLCLSRLHEGTTLAWVGTAYPVTYPPSSSFYKSQNWQRQGSRMSWYRVPCGSSAARTHNSSRSGYSVPCGCSVRRHNSHLSGYRVPRGSSARTHNSLRSGYSVFDVPLTSG